MTDSSWRILLIEDNPGDAELLKRALSHARTKFDVQTAVDLAEGLRATSADSWDVILADLSLPDSYGLDTVRELRRCAPLLPIVVLTSLDCDDVALSSLDEGAQDYLVKDTVTPEILERAIRYAVQRQKNAEMRRLVDKLQASERSLEKKNKRLASMYKTAHRFVDNVSHEFRTPLTVIKEYVSLLRDGVVGDINGDQREMLEVAADRTDDLCIMVDDMLDISRLEAGMLGIWRRSCRVSDIVARVRVGLQRKSSVKQVDLRIDVPDDLPEVFCDDEKIGRVIINLTTNAIKFCGRPGQVRLWAKLDPQGRQVTVGVTDNGSGISPENLALIFRRFKQVGGNPRGSTRGFGLGLNIAKELVHLNLGAITVESKLGQESTFSFTVPVNEPMVVMQCYLDRISQLQKRNGVVSLVWATIATPCDVSLADHVNTFLNTVLRRNDLLLRKGVAEWLIAIPREQPELEHFFRRVDEIRLSTNRNRLAESLPSIAMSPLGTWSLPEQADGILAAVLAEFAGDGSKTALPRSTTQSEPVQRSAADGLGRKATATKQNSATDDLDTSRNTERLVPVQG
ncbi:MAG: hybrid sensor histidine kinase/response regulator [Planctomycetaceae bacterium]